MNAWQKFLTIVYAGLWVFLAWVLYNDMFVWRKHGPDIQVVKAAVRR